VSNSTQTVGDNTFVDSRVVAKGTCKLAAVTGYNNGVDRFVHIHETGAVPDDGATPLWCFPADAGRPFAFALAIPTGVGMDACTIVFSSTAETTTATSSEDASIQAILNV
jgi:hypothetical protein